MIEVKRYYRPNEIPDGVYMPLMQDRVTENRKQFYIKHSRQTKYFSLQNLL